MRHTRNLHEFLAYCGLPVQSVRQVCADPMQVDVVWSRSLTANEQAKAQGMAASCGCQLLIPQTKSERSVVTFASTKPVEAAEVPESILLTGGLGDVFALESFFPVEMRQVLHTIYYASPVAKEVSRLFSCLPNYPRLQNHIDLGATKTYYRKSEVEKDFGKVPAKDFSIASIFSDLKEYTGSSLLTYTLAEVRKPVEPYMLICPSSAWGQWSDRDFNEADWQTAITFLEQRQRLGLVVQHTNHKVPHHRLLRLAEDMPIEKAVELCKGATGYMGIDTCWSVLAAKLWTCLSVKSNQQGGADTWKHVYYAPRKAFDFLHAALRSPTSV